MNEKIIYLIFAIINIFSFIIIGIDKKRAIKNEKRIKEGYLLFLAIIFGAPGILLGMLSFRHKIRTIYIVIGVSICIFQNIYFLNLLLSHSK